MIEAIGGRKAFACLSAVIVAVGAFIYKGDVPSGLADIIKYIVTTYVAGNIGADIVAAAQAKTEVAATQTAVVAAAVEQQAIAPAPSAEVDLSPVTSRLEAIEGSLNVMVGSTSTTQQGVSYIISRMGGQAG